MVGWDGSSLFQLFQATRISAAEEAMEVVDINSVTKAIEEADLDAGPKAILETALEAAKDDPEALQAVMDQLGELLK